MVGVSSVKVSLSIAKERGNGRTRRETAACGLLLVPNEETEKRGESKPAQNAREAGKRDGVPAIRLIVKRRGVAR